MLRILTLIAVALPFSARAADSPSMDLMNCLNTLTLPTSKTLPALEYTDRGTLVGFRNGQLVLKQGATEGLSLLTTQGTVSVNGLTCNMDRSKKLGAYIATQLGKLADRYRASTGQPAGSWGEGDFDLNKPRIKEVLDRAIDSCATAFPEVGDMKATLLQTVSASPAAPGSAAGATQIH